MAYVPVALYRGTPATGAAATVYTASSNVLVKSFVVSNNTSAAATVTASLGGVAMLTALSVAANSVTVIDSGMLGLLASTEVLALGQGTAAALTVRVLGVTF